MERGQREREREWEATLVRYSEQETLKSRGVGDTSRIFSQHYNIWLPPLHMALTCLMIPWQRTPPLSFYYFSSHHHLVNYPGHVRPIIQPCLGHVTGRSQWGREEGELKRLRCVIWSIQSYYNTHMCSCREERRGVPSWPHYSYKTSSFISRVWTGTRTNTRSYSLSVRVLAGNNTV